MIKFENGDIFTSSTQCLVNTVNCEGYMGKGLAYQFKLRFPENNKHYKAACKSGKFGIGNILFFQENNKLIANFPTKNKWREKSRYTYIQSGLNTLKQEIISRHITSIVIPPLGCGNGGLDWNVVKKMICDSLHDLPIDIVVTEPTKNVSQKVVSVPQMKPSHLILMEIKRRLNPNCFSKLRLQKTAFFMNVFAGEDYFKFEQYKFGPYAHSIDVLSREIKEFQAYYHTDTAAAEKIAYNNIISSKTQQIFDKFRNPIIQAADFVNSITSDHQLEAVATVADILRTNPEFNNDEITSYFLRKYPKENPSRFSETEIRNAIYSLSITKILKKQ